MMNKEYIRLGAIFASGLAIGWGVGYLTTKNRLEKKADDEIAQALETFKRRYKVGEYSTPEAIELNQTVIPAPDLDPEELRKDAAYANGLAEGAGYRQDDTESEELREKAESILRDGTVMEVTDSRTTVVSVFDQEIDTSKPYVIPIEVFMSEEDDHAKISLAYYAGDEVLMEEGSNSVISPKDIDKIVSENALIRFGEQSQDRNTVYVRNEELKADYEIIRTDNSYEQDVLGMDPHDTDHPKLGRLPSEE